MLFKYAESYKEQKEHVRNVLSSKYKNINAVPMLRKVVVNICYGIKDKKKAEDCISILESITSQKPIRTKAKKSMSQFKTRTGMYIGVKVDLRKDNMYNFMKKLVFIVMPKIFNLEAFTEKNCDGRGNISIGIPHATLFLESLPISADSIGMDIAICTSARNNKECITLIKEWGIPVREKV